MGKDSAIQQAINERFKTPSQTFTAMVVKVDKAAKTISVKDAEGFDWYDVRLRSAIDGNKNKVVLHPAVNSSVLISRIGKDNHALFVSAVSEVESIEGVLNDTKFCINENGYAIYRENENLKEVLNDFIEDVEKLCDELVKVVVSIGVSPDVPAIIKIKTDLETKIKKRLNTILK